MWGERGGVWGGGLEDGKKDTVDRGEMIVVLRKDILPVADILVTQGDGVDLALWVKAVAGIEGAGEMEMDAAVLDLVVESELEQIEVLLKGGGIEATM